MSARRPQSKRTTRTTAWLVASTLFLIGVLATSATAVAHQTSWGQGESEPEDLAIALVTFSPGDDISQWFGHSALVVEDRRDGALHETRLYNYGLFSLNDDDLLAHFAMGRLWFRVGNAPTERSINRYIREDRDVRRIDLNIPPEARKKVAEFLADNVRPENRDYLYHHYDDNCATRVRDVIDMAVDGQFKETYEDKPGRMTLREHTRRHSQHSPAMDWLLMYLMNYSIDEPTTVWEEMFLPAELEARVLEFEWEDEEGNLHPLVLREHELYRAEDRDAVPAQPSTHWPWWLLVGLAVGGLGMLVGWISRRRPGRWSRVGYGSYQLLVGLILGLPGLKLAFMATFTDHTVTYWNQNLFWAHPLTLAVAAVAVMVLFGSVRGRRWMVKLWTILSAVVAVGVVVNLLGWFVPALYQDTSSAMALMVPVVWGATASAWLVDGKLVREDRI